MSDKKNETAENEKLKSFSWDLNDETITSKKETLSTEEKKQAKKVEKVEKVEKTEKTEKTNVDGILNFDDEEKTDEKEVEKIDKVEKPNNSQETDEKFFNILATGMKEKGVLSSVEIPEDTIDEEAFIELHENEVNNRVSETFEGFFEELDDDATAFLKHKRDGGETRSFFDVLQTSSSIPKGDLEDEKFQKVVARYYFENVEGIEPEDIDEKLSWLEDTGKTAKYAEKYLTKIEKDQAKKIKAIDKSNKDAIKLEQDNVKAFKKTIKDSLSSITTVKDFEITAKDKKELLSFITEPAVKAGNNKYVTGLQEGLKKLMKDEKKLILLAKLIKSDFDISGLKVKAQTKETVKLKDKLQKAKTNVEIKTSNAAKRPLSDFF